jgi:predicted nuclease of restriction endonuclease-like RecB superfamily
MLPSELLATRRWKGTIRPKYSSINKETFAIVNDIIGVYQESIGKSKEEIKEKLSVIEDAVFDYRFVRGIAALIERKCAFTSVPTVESTLVRQELFVASARKGFPTVGSERQAIVAEVSEKLKITPEQLESSFYADLDSEKVLQSVTQEDPVQLLKKYNLSLSQTLLFYCTEMHFTASGNWQNIFRSIKQQGLIYTTTKQGTVFAVKLDGPLSLFKLNRRYGVALAKTLPEIMKGKPWTLDAQILHKQSNQLLNFQLESGRHGWMFPEAPETEAYDSTIESEFAKDFEAFGTPWTLKREPEPVIVGNAVMIPDFTLQLGATKVFLEIMGFWTKQYVEKKVEKLREIRNVPFILAVDEALACEKVARLVGLNIIYYKHKVQVRKIIEILRPLERSEAAKQTAELQITVTVPVTTVSRLAAEKGTMEEAILQSVNKITTHILIGETLIEKGLVETIRQHLELEIGDKEVSLTQALALLQQYTLPETIPVLMYCGYKIKWHGISMENAKVTKN